MKSLKILGFLPLLVALFIGTAFAAEQYMGLEDYSMGVPAQSQKALSGSVYYTGTLAALDEASHEILVKTTVPGLLGPEETIVPFRINDETTMTICFKSTGECVAATTGSEGWEALKNYEDRSDFALARKDIVLVGDPESDRIVHVQIDYDL